MDQYELTGIYEPQFSASSFGFRPGRGAHDALRQAQGFVESGKTWVVDLDLEKYFDTVNHDRLMARLSRDIKDKRVLKLIRRYLQAGVLQNGVILAYTLTGLKGIARKSRLRMRKRVRALTYRNRGRSLQLAMSSKGWWRLSRNPVIHQALPNPWFEKQGLFSLLKSYDQWSV